MLQALSNHWPAQNLPESPSSTLELLSRFVRAPRMCEPAAGYIYEVTNPFYIWDGLCQVLSLLNERVMSVYLL